MRSTIGRSCLLACLLLAAQAQAQAAPSDTAAGEVEPATDPGSDAEPEGASTPEPEAASTAEPDTAADPGALDDDPSAASPSATVQAEQIRTQRTRELEAALREVEREEQERSRLLPWLVLGAGVAMLTAGVALGAGKAIACDDSCTMPFWPAWLVVVGAGVGTGGGVLLVLDERESAELRSRRYRIETELQWLEWSVPQPTSPKPRAAAQLTLGHRF